MEVITYQISRTSLTLVSSALVQLPEPQKQLDNHFVRIHFIVYRKQESYNSWENQIYIFRADHQFSL